jgi:hypothetical protein
MENKELKNYIASVAKAVVMFIYGMSLLIVGLIIYIPGEKNSALLNLNIKFGLVLYVAYALVSTLFLYICYKHIEKAE